MDASITGVPFEQFTGAPTLQSAYDNDILPDGVLVPGTNGARLKIPFLDPCSDDYSCQDLSSADIFEQSKKADDQALLKALLRVRELDPAKSDQMMEEVARRLAPARRDSLTRVYNEAVGRVTQTIEAGAVLSAPQPSTTRDDEISREAPADPLLFTMPIEDKSLEVARHLSSALGCSVEEAQAAIKDGKIDKSEVDLSGLTPIFDEGALPTILQFIFESHFPREGATALMDFYRNARILQVIRTRWSALKGRQVFFQALEPIEVAKNGVPMNAAIGFLPFPVDSIAPYVQDAKKFLDWAPTFVKATNGNNMSQVELEIPGFNLSYSINFHSDSSGDSRCKGAYWSRIDGDLNPNHGKYYLLPAKGGTLVYRKGATNTTGFVSVVEGWNWVLNIARDGMVASFSGLANKVADLHWKREEDGEEKPEHYGQYHYFKTEASSLEW